MRVTVLAASIVAFFVPLAYANDSVADVDHIDDIDTDIADAAIASCRGYAASNIVDISRGVQMDLDLLGPACAAYGPDVSKLRLVVQYEAGTRLHVVIQDREGERYQVPQDVFPRPSTADFLQLGPELSFTFKKDPFSFQVIRKATGEVLFDTTGTSLIFERQFLRLRTWLPDDPNIYGLGEHTDSFRLKNDGYKRTFWARDAGAVPHGTNLYGSHPIYVDHRLSGTHGVFLVNSNGMEIVLDKDKEKNGTYFLEYRPIGGILDFYFFAGPSPVDVAKQYAEVVGTPAMIPYWSLGFHQCKYGYQDWFEVAEVVHNHSLAGIPVETVWTDIDYMDHRRIFTLDENRFPVNKMQEVIDYIHDRNQHYILMIDPAVAEYDYHAYNRGIEMDVFLKRKDKKSPYRGVVWPGVTVFPDWYHPNASDYWQEMFNKTFDAEKGIDIDGVWIDMNEPASFCRSPCNNPEKQARDRGLPPRPPPTRQPPRAIPGLPSSQGYSTSATSLGIFHDQHRLLRRDVEMESAPQEIIQVNVDHRGDDLLHPPYKIRNSVPSGELSDLTVDTDLQHANGQWTYDVHNLYGMLMGIETRKAMLRRRPNQRPFIITRSTFAGSGRYVGKWLGDNVSKWDHYRTQIPGMLNFASIFQIPMVGSDVCGFLGRTNEKLCARWATLGAFNPFYRNHADDVAPHQEFYLWPLVTEAAKYAISTRYRLLDYIYTALAQQSRDGTPALNPLWYAYPQDEQTFPIDMQFFYGSCVLVSPVTGDEATKVSIYLPNDVFYDWETGKKVRGRGEFVEVLDVPYDRIPLHVRGGCVVPLRAESANTTTDLRTKGFELLVAPGLDGKAFGSLYLDDGISLDGGPNRTEVYFEYADGNLMVGNSEGMKPAELRELGINVEKITVLGQDDEIDDSESDAEL